MTSGDAFVVLGVSGGIAAYKAVTLCNLLVQSGAEVEVILSEGALAFVTAQSFEALVGRPVVTGTHSLERAGGIGDASPRTQTDLIIVAPATANTIAKLAMGLADDPLTTTVLTTGAPVLLAPAMETHMWAHPATQADVDRLRGLLDVGFIGPAEGGLASGAYGVGRMAEPKEILAAALDLLARRGPLPAR